MPKGLAIPLRANASGGLQTVDGEENDQKIIMAALGDDDNDNAFQQNIGLGSGMIFDINDPIARTRIVGRLVAVFQRFEAQKRFKLRTETLRWDEGEEGELVLTFKYVNLEADEERDFRRNYLRDDLGENAGYV